MRKKTAAMIAMCLTMACTAGVGSTASADTATDAAGAGSATATEYTRVYFDALDKAIRCEEQFTLTAKSSGGNVVYRSLDANVATITADGDTVTVTGTGAGVTYIVALDEDGRVYNACRVAVAAKQGGSETPDPDKPDKPVDPDPDEPDPDKPDPKPQETNGNMEYDRYDLNTYIYPYWRGNTVYNETCMFVGDTDASSLMYPASKILKVTSYDHTVTYEEGKDYTYDKANNLLKRTATSRMPATAVDDWYFTADRATALGTVTAFPYKSHEGKYLFFAEGNTISNKQVSVTYEHEQTAVEEWQLPQTRKDNFARLHAKLTAGQDVQVLYYGDSVVYGANASGQVNCGLQAPTYAQMISAYMRDKYKVNVTEQNAATGGTRSDQGAQYFPEYRTGLKNNPDGTQSTYQAEAVTVTPDLVVIGYGLNDSAQGRTTAQYIDSINTLVHKARQKWANVDILIVSPSLGNPEAGIPGYPELSIYHDDDAQEQALLNWYDETAVHYGGVAVAQVTKMYRQLYHKKGNRYRDFTGNNVNHPNDTGTRLIAQTCLYTLFGEDYFK